MGYKKEELVPIVAKLAEGYTSKESTSISYDRAEQLMKAVVYCIREFENKGKNSLRVSLGMPALEAYLTGREYVEEKVKNALQLYNEICVYFCSYDNECLQNTVVDGMPEFFKWYDCRFNPQDTILTLDYPVLKDLSNLSGIDRIFEYLKCIETEQKFLSGLPKAFVMSALNNYDGNYRYMIDNLCEAVLSDLAGKILSRDMGLEELRGVMKDFVGRFITDYFDMDEELEEYLSAAAENIVVRFFNTVA